MDELETYISIHETALLLILPAIFCLTVASWILAWLVWGHDYRVGVVIAIVNTMILGFGCVLTFSTLYRSRVGMIPAELLAANATSVLGILIVPFIITAYLIWRWLVTRGD